jgi:putative DNA primase/helicase
MIDAIVDGYDTEGNPIPKHFNLATDLNRLDKLLSDLKDVALVIIDPISAYLGKTDSHKTAEVRALLAPLSKLAEKHNVAVLCVSHLNKGGSGEALLRITGSLGFVAAARAAYLVAKDKDDDHKRLFLPMKNNLGDDWSGLSFTIESSLIDKNIKTSHIVWSSEIISTTADEALAYQAKSQETKNTRDEEQAFLRDLLIDGSRPATAIKEAAKEAGYAWRTIERAKKDLGIKPVQIDGHWVWSLIFSQATRPPYSISQEKDGGVAV